MNECAQLIASLIVHSLTLVNYRCIVVFS